MTPRTTQPGGHGVELEEVVARLRAGKKVRRSVTPWGRLAIDRALPFLCVYRRPEQGPDDPLAAGLVSAVASYLTISGGRAQRRSTAQLVESLLRTLAADFGSVLLIEVWVRPVPKPQAPGGALIVRLRRDAIPGVADELESALANVRLPTLPRLTVETATTASLGPPGCAPLVGRALRETGACHQIGIELPAVYTDADFENFFPPIHRALRLGLARAVNRSVYRFTRQHTTQRPPHYHAMGRRSFTKSAWIVDKQLAEVSGSFDFLLLTTPRNTEEAWSQFKRSRFERAPRFSYRPRPFDIAIAKRQLYSVPIERIEDPTVSELFREQQDEIDRKLTMIADRGTPRFVQESLQLFGGADDTLLQTAIDILERIPARSREVARGGWVDAATFAARAEEEIKALRERYPGVTAKVQIRDDVPGLLVSRGDLLVGANNKLPSSRVEALIQHEVGTHILTYFNGKAQPFAQLRVGLPRYEELQEGLAVLAEYLIGGLSRPRLRLLAARVVATRHMLEGATFVDVFRELDRQWDLAQRTAFTTTMRVFRGGGHTKDCVYVRGLIALLGYLESGKPLEALYTGKIALHHLDFVEELTYRKVLVPPPLRPTYLERPDVQARLQRLREGIEVHELALPATRHKRRRAR